MTELELLNNNTLAVDSGSGSEGHQSDDEDQNVENILDPPRIDGILEREPSAIKDGLSNIDEDMTETQHSKINQDDATLILSLLDTSNKEAPSDRKIYHTNQENEVTTSTEDCFRKAECSHIQTKILKRTDLVV